MDLNRIKELAGTAQLNEVSDALVRDTIKRRQQSAHAAADRHNTAGQTPDSVERTGEARSAAVNKLGNTYDAAAARLQRRERMRKQQQLSVQAQESLRLAGVLIEEAYDDDDEDPDVKIANADKRQREFEKKNAKAIKAAEDSADASDDTAESTKLAATAEKKEEKAAEKPAEKKEEAKSAAAKGRKPSERGGSCRQWLTDHPGATRGQFVAHCVGLGMSKAHANTSFYALKKKVAASTNEAFMIVHPLDSGTILAENTRLRRYEWIDICEHNDYVSPMVFDSLFEAEAIVSGMGLMSQAGIATEIGDDGEAVE